MTSASSTKKAALLFIGTGLLALVLGAVFGLVGAIQFAYPQWFKEELPFTVTRPMHVSLVISWILFGAIGGVYYYLQASSERSLRFPRLPLFHFLLFTVTGGILLICYLNRMFGGREYFEYPPVFSGPIILGWGLFACNVLPAIFQSARPRPVYYWMWGTSAVLVLFVLIEAHLWLLPYFGDYPIRDLAVQWKSYGSLIGCWNLLIYGTATYLMCRMTNDTTPALQTKTFLLFFIGLSNTMFNWGHHTYIVPTAPWIKYVSYAVSMAELIILAAVIHGWRLKLKDFEKKAHILSFRFLVAAEAWVIINLVLAILISVPAINIYTHGTHITVAHAMGTTIGINTMILLASVLYIVAREREFEKSKRSILRGYYLLNISLACFFICLLAAGIRRAYGVFGQTGEAFSTVTEAIRPFVIGLGIAGVGILLGFLLIVVPIVISLCSSRPGSQPNFVSTENFARKVSIAALVLV